MDFYIVLNHIKRSSSSNIVSAYFSSIKNRFISVFFILSLSFDLFFKFLGVENNHAFLQLLQNHGWKLFQKRISIGVHKRTVGKTSHITATVYHLEHFLISKHVSLFQLLKFIDYSLCGFL